MIVTKTPKATVETVLLYYNDHYPTHATHVSGRVSFTKGQFITDTPEKFPLGERFKEPVTDSRNGLTYHGFLPVTYYSETKTFEFYVDYYELINEL